MSLYKSPLQQLIEQYTKTEKHKVFLSYYHKADEYYKKKFEELFGHLYLSYTVEPNEFDSDNDDEYIKMIEAICCMKEASVVIVLVGAKTYCRKHVDWEISAGLSSKIGGASGLLGICLPTNTDYFKQNFTSSITPPRLVDNITSGYAKYYNWTENEDMIKKIIDEAFDARISKKNLINNSRLQMIFDECS